MNPLPSLWNSLLAAPHPFTRGISLCAPVHFWLRYIHSVPHGASEQQHGAGFGAIYSQSRQTAVCAKLSMSDVQQAGGVGASEIKFVQEGRESVWLVPERRAIKGLWPSRRHAAALLLLNTNMSTRPVLGRYDEWLKNGSAHVGTRQS